MCATRGEMSLSFALMIYALTGCIEDVKRPSAQMEGDRSSTYEPQALRTDQDFCQALNPKPPLHEVEGTRHGFGGCGHLYFVNERGYWLDGPGLSEPLLVSAPDNIVTSSTLLSDPYFQIIWLLLDSGDPRIIDLHGPWISEPVERYSELVVQLANDTRGVLALKRDREREVTELKLFAQGEMTTLAEGRYPYHLQQLDSGDVRRKVAFYNEEGAWVIHFDHPNGPRVEALALEDFSWSPGLEFNQGVRQDEVIIDRSGERLLHVKYNFTELDHYVETTWSEATLYQLDTLTPIAQRRDDGGDIGTSMNLELCLLSDLKMRSGCLTGGDPAELFTVSGAQRSLEGGRVGGDAKTSTVWHEVSTSDGGLEVQIYDTERGTHLGSIPPYQLPRLNTDRSGYANEPNAWVVRGQLSSSMLIERREEEAPSLPSLYYVDLFGGGHRPLVDADQAVSREGGPYYYSSPTFKVSGPSGDELRWYVKRAGELVTLTIPLSMTPAWPWEATDGRLFYLEEPGLSATLKVYDAEQGQERRYGLMERYDQVQARAYPLLEGSPGVIFAESSLRPDRLLIGFPTSADELP